MSRSPWGISRAAVLLKPVAWPLCMVVAAAASVVVWMLGCGDLRAATSRSDGVAADMSFGYGL